MAGTLFVVATPIGNLEDIGARALRILAEVAIVAAEDTRRTAHLLARFGIRTPTTSLHEHNEHAKTPGLVSKLLEGRSVALVSDAGTPGLSDPGSHLIRAALDAGLRVEPIPGPSAVMALLSVSGFPCSPFTFLGFPPTKPGARDRWFASLASISHTVVFFESPHRIERTLRQTGDVLGECQIVVGRELTKAHEQLLRGTVSKVVSELGSPRGEFGVVIDLGNRQISANSAAPQESELLTSMRSVMSSKGVGVRAAAHEVAGKFGLSTNYVYRLAVSLRDPENR